MVNAAPSTQGIVDWPGRPLCEMLGMALESKNGRDGWVGLSVGGITALGGSLCPTKLSGESTNSCTQLTLGTKNSFDNLQDLSEGSGG